MTTKTKAKTVTVRVAVIYDADGQFQAGGYGVGRATVNDDKLVVDAKEAALAELRCLPNVCLVDIELPIPEPVKPLVGRVLNVKAVKP